MSITHSSIYLFDVSAVTNASSSFQVTGDGCGLTPNLKTHCCHLLDWSVRLLQAPTSELWKGCLLSLRGCITLQILPLTELYFMEFEEAHSFVQIRFFCVLLLIGRIQLLCNQRDSNTNMADTSVWDKFYLEINWDQDFGVR